ncbi:putative kinesin motor domain, P-loop containing nucleoside triphosphate hydrolase [Helianthus debilis subsp. tardiflorus]
MMMMGKTHLNPNYSKTFWFVKLGIANLIEDLRFVQIYLLHKLTCIVHISSHKVKENVTVTVRLRPLNSREIGRGNEVAWFADGDYSIQNEFNPTFAYGFDRVFGPVTTTRQVYDVPAHYVVNGAMEGVNGHL